MKILIADDDPSTLRLVEHSVQKLGHEVIAVDDGFKALQKLQVDDPPQLAILDWNMPEMEGIEIVRRLRSQTDSNYVYTILLTGRSEKTDMLNGLDAGADDFVIKPFDRRELRSRVQVGERIVSLKQELDAHNQKLEALNEKLACANDRLREDFDTAATFQQSLLPKKAPESDAVNIEWLYKPCQELAGDMLNVFRLDKQHIGFYLLDVSGHGVSASFLTGTVSRLLTPVGGQSSLVRSKEPGAPDYRLTPPAEVMTRLNAQFYFDQDSPHYFTVAYAILNTRTGELRYSAAGHPPLLLIRAGGESLCLEMNSFPIGFVPEAGYQSRSLHVLPGDRLYLYSDGIVEVMDRHMEMFGNQRLEGLLKKEAASPLRASLAATVAAVEDWTAGEIGDDISILALELKE